MKAIDTNTTVWHINWYATIVNLLLNASWYIIGLVMWVIMYAWFPTAFMACAGIAIGYALFWAIAKVMK